MKITERFFTIPINCKMTKGVKEKSKNIENSLSLIEKPCVIFLDQSNNTGGCIFDNKRRLVSSFYFSKDKGEDNVEFRVALKNYLSNLIDKYEVDKLVCEDIFIDKSMINSYDVISGVKATIENLSVEKDVKVYFIPNTKWKSTLLEGTYSRLKNDKEQIYEVIKEWYPNIVKGITEHEIDSLGIAIATLFKNKNIRPLEFALNKKLPVEIEIKAVGDLEEISDLIDKSTIVKRKKNRDKKIIPFEFDTSLKVEDNFKYILTNIDCIALTEIPDHRRRGMIMFEYNIDVSEYKEKGALIAIGSRK